MKARHSNVIIRIQDSDKNRYLEKGFDIYTDDGKLIQKAIPTDLGSLRKAYIEQEQIIKKLQEKISQLESDGTEKTVQKRQRKSKTE